MQRILIVDDEEPIVFTLSRYLGRRGFVAVCAQELEEAEALLLDGDFDVVIADLRLTGVHGAEGLDLITFVKRHRPRTRTILMTAFGSESVRQEALRRGADMVLEKPQPLQTIADAVNQVLAGLSA